MAKYQCYLNPKYTSKEGNQLGIKLSYGNKTRFHPIGESIDKKFWSGERVSKDHPDHKRLNSLLQYELSKAQSYFAECRIKQIPIDIDLVFKEIKSHSFTGYLEKRQDQHRKSEQIEFELKVKRFLKEIRWCFQRHDVYFSELSQDFLRELDRWLSLPLYKDGVEIKKINVGNTRYKKFEFLGKYWNDAADEGLISGKNPFEIYKSKIPTLPTKKEKLSHEDIMRLENLQLKPSLTSLARDLFLFSYYCRGIRFETVITMPKSAVGERLSYDPNKKGAFQTAAIHPKLRAIIDRYIQNPTDTIFGRLSSSEIDTRKKKRSKIGSENALMNRELKTVAELAGIAPFSFHQARHTTAYHLKLHTKNIHVISDTLGHSRTSTTEKYLSKLGDEYLDEQTLGIYYK